MTAKRKKQSDKKIWIIGILSVVVLVETLLLLEPLRTKIFPRMGAAKVVQINQPPLLSAEKDFKRKKAAGSKAATASIPTVITLPKGSSGKIAFILDDWGYHLNSCRDLKSIDAPIAVAILPKLEHSRGIAQCAHEHNKVVMLHLPLEPHKYLETYPDDYYIKTSMTEKRINRMLEEALEDIPYVEGVNNHTGSKATEDVKTMSIIFKRLKEKDLFFVDSLVTGESVCWKVAKQNRLNFARRDIFLDNEDRRDYIEAQFIELAKEAKTKGYAIAIGHDRPLTLKILQEQIKILEEQGFQIVSIKELLKSN